jgi:hypothetical protein
MSSGPWLSDWDLQRIRAMADAKLTARQIAERMGNICHRNVRRLINGKRKPSRKRLAHIRLAHESRPTHLQHTREATMRPETVREIFIDALTPAHFAKPRAGAERFFSDLAADLAREGFTAPVLVRAAEILRGERVGTFPKIPVCKRACVRAKIELGGAGPGPDGPGGAPAESVADDGGAPVAVATESATTPAAPDGGREPTGAASQRARVAA